MTDPIVFISRNRIKPGKAEEFRQHYRASVPLTMEGKPGTFVQLGYGDEGNTLVTIIRLFPNAEALDLQIQGADERSKKTYEFIEPTGIEIYGSPSPSTLEKMMKIAGLGVAVQIYPDYMGGFIR